MANEQLIGFLSGSSEIIGTLSATEELVGNLSATEELVGNLSIPNRIGFPYTGTYEVTPKVTEQVLETRDKYMSDDVMVHRVPRWDTSNPYGVTVFIATEVINNGN